MSTDNQENTSMAEVKSRPVDAIKKPPKEDAGIIRMKTWTMAAFWSVVIFLGIPIWLWTTSIHRASLPVQDMLNLADGKSCQLDLRLWIDVQAPYMTNVQTRGILATTDSRLEGQHIFDQSQVQWNLSKTLESDHHIREEDVALQIKLEPVAVSATTLSVQLQPHSKILKVKYNLQAYKSDHAVVSNDMSELIATKMIEIFSEEQASFRHLLQQYPGFSEQTGRSPPAETANDASFKRIRSLKYSPTYHISLSLFTSGASPTSWAINEAIAEYLQPLLDSYSLSNFTVDTQLQIYAPFSPSMQAPQFDEAKKIWTLREEDLSSFINAAEWPLSPTIGGGPTLNFILYVPDDASRPLVVKDSGANNWIVPQWGGVSILNMPGSTSDRLTKKQLQSAMFTISHQLLSLLGAPDRLESFPLQLQALTRFHAVSQMLSASSTLGSLARLSQSLSTIPIPEEVLSRVNRALGLLNSACNELPAGKAKLALEYARQAEAEAEKAFFEKDMVSQVYFPDEHKAAVYLPLLGPIGVSLLTSVFREVKRRRAASRS